MWDITIVGRLYEYLIEKQTFKGMLSFMELPPTNRIREEDCFPNSRCRTLSSSNPAEPEPHLFCLIKAVQSTDIFWKGW